MAARSIKVKIIKETSSTVTIKMISLNRKMPVPKEDFEKRVKQGLYEVVGQESETEEYAPDAPQVLRLLAEVPEVATPSPSYPPFLAPNNQIYTSQDKKMIPAAAIIGSRLSIAFK